MTNHNPPFGTLMLRVLDYLSIEHSFTLARLSPDLIVEEATEQFQGFQGDPSIPPIGHPISELIWELVGNESGLKEILEGKTEVFNLKNINRVNENGSIYYLDLKVIPLDKHQPNQGLLLIIEDTTYTSSLEQQLIQDRNELRLTQNILSKTNEELSKLNRLKSIFLSIAAHDLRSPLTAIRGYADLAAIMLSPKENPDAIEYLTIVRSLVDIQSRLISDFLDLDVIEQGKLKIRPEPCDLNKVIRDVVEAMNFITARKNVVIETKLSEDIPLIHADPDRMQQILFNLLSNAVKYTKEGDHVQVETMSHENGAQLSVADHGPGIPEADIPFLFDIYHRTEDARQSSTKGLGLGLFIVKSLVDLHHGQVKVESELEKGTTFIISIPKAETANP